MHSYRADETCDFDVLPNPVQLNVIADHLAILMHSWISVYPAKLLSSSCRLPAESIFVKAPGIPQARKDARILTNEFPEYELPAYMHQHNNPFAYCSQCFRFQDPSRATISTDGCRLWNRSVHTIPYVDT
jgi:hypothetical protein